jgi:hypothetical protein
MNTNWKDSYKCPQCHVLQMQIDSPVLTGSNDSGFQNPDPEESQFDWSNL